MNAPNQSTSPRTALRVHQVTVGNFPPDSPLLPLVAMPLPEHHLRPPIYIQSVPAVPPVVGDWTEFFPMYDGTELPIEGVKLVFPQGADIQIPGKDPSFLPPGVYDATVTRNAMTSPLKIIVMIGLGLPEPTSDRYIKIVLQNPPDPGGDGGHGGASRHEQPQGLASDVFASGASASGAPAQDLPSSR